MADNTKFLGYTDVLADSLAGMQDFWMIAEGPALMIATPSEGPAPDTLIITAGFHSVDGTGTIQYIEGAQRNGQFVVLRFAEGSAIDFGSSGNIRAASGTRPGNRWVMLVYRDDYWEEQATTPGAFVASVLSFKGRIGEVEPEAGDYTADQVSAVNPVDGNPATVQVALDGVNGVVDSILTAGIVESFNGRSGPVVTEPGDYTSTLVPITPFTVAGTTIPGPTIQLALQQMVASAGTYSVGGVLSFLGRDGNVIPLAGDYTAAMVAATDPTGGGASTTQDVIENLNEKIDAINASAEGGISGIITAGQSFGRGSTGWPTFTAKPGDYPADFIASPEVQPSVIASNGLPSGTPYVQIASLAHREAHSSVYAGAGMNPLINSKPTVGEALDAIPAGLVTESTGLPGTMILGAQENTTLVVLPSTVEGFTFGSPIPAGHILAGWFIGGDLLNAGMDPATKRWFSADTIAGSVRVYNTSATDTVTAHMRGIPIYIKL